MFGLFKKRTRDFSEYKQQDDSLPDFDQLKEEARAAFDGSNPEPSLNALWLATYKLTQWHCLPAKFIQETVKLRVTRTDGMRLVLCFTEKARAEHYAKTKNLMIKGKSLVISASPKDIITLVNQQHNIDGIVFNQSKKGGGYLSELDNLEPMYEYYLADQNTSVDIEQPPH